MSSSITAGLNRESGLRVLAGVYCVCCADRCRRRSEYGELRDNAREQGHERSRHPGIPTGTGGLRSAVRSQAGTMPHGACKQMEQCRREMPEAFRHVAGCLPPRGRPRSVKLLVPDVRYWRRADLARVRLPTPSRPRLPGLLTSLDQGHGIAFSILKPSRLDVTRLCDPVLGLSLRSVVILKFHATAF